MPHLDTPLERKLTAILYADVAGYSRLTEEDEAGTHRLLSASLDYLTNEIGRYNGKVEHYAGDAILAEFPSVILAVACALTAQAELARKQSHLPEEHRVKFRIAINLGEVIVDRGEIYGEGVNIAARLESLGEPGEVWISALVQHEVRGKLPLDCVDMGEHRVKNIAEPLRAFRVKVKDGAALPSVEALVPRRRSGAKLRPIVIVLAIALAASVILLGTVTVTWLSGFDPADSAYQQPHGMPSLAVLPFQNLSEDPAQAYFAHGMTDDLITDLSKIPGLFVIAGNSSALYENAKMDIRDIARELGVRYILTGTLRRTPLMLRLNTQLIDAESGASLWAERYDADLVQIFALQDVIVSHVVAALSAGTSPTEVLAKRTTKIVNIDAYDLFLQGWAHYQRETPEGYSDAIPFLTGALELDPSFDRPHAVLAAIYYQGRLRRWNRDWGLSDHEAFRMAYEHLKSAKAEPTALGLSTSALMHIHNGRHELAIGEAEKAIGLDGNDPTAHIVLAYALSTAGEGSSAIEYAMQAMRLNPHYPASYVWTLGLAYFVNADYERARKFFEEAGTDQAGLDLVPLLATYGFLGREEEAGKIFELQLSRWREWHPGYPMTVRSLVAEFPPFLKQLDRDRVSDGLGKAIAQRLSLRPGSSILGLAGSARGAHGHWPAAALVRKGRLWGYYRPRGFASQ